METKQMKIAIDALKRIESGHPEGSHVVIAHDAMNRIDQENVLQAFRAKAADVCTVCKLPRIDCLSWGKDTEAHRA